MTAAAMSVTAAAAGCAALEGTLVALDLEATGLHNRPRITELSLLAVHTANLPDPDHSDSCGSSSSEDAASPPPPPSGTRLPRVLNGLCLVFHPMKPIEPEAEAVSRLDNLALERHKEFDRDAAVLIDAFLKRLEPPVFLVAHNGLKFDFPLLRSELDAVGVRLESNPLCCDTLPLFRSLEPRGPCNLGDLHARFIGWRPADAHSAAVDCASLMRLLIARVGPCLDWVRTESVPLEDVSPMYTARAREQLPDFPYKL